MKKLLSILLAACMAVAMLSGCSKKAEEQEKPVEVTESQTDPATAEQQSSEQQEEAAKPEESAAPETETEPEEEDNEIVYLAELPEGTRVFRFIGMNEGEEEMASEDIELMESFGLYGFMYLNADGTGSLNIYGETTELTWKDGKAMMHDGDDIQEMILDIDEEGNASLTAGEDATAYGFKFVEMDAAEYVELVKNIVPFEAVDPEEPATEGEAAEEGAEAEGEEEQEQTEGESSEAAEGATE